MASPAQMDRDKKKASKSQGSPGQRNKGNKSIGGGGGSSKKSSSSKLNKEQKNILKDLDKAQKNLDKKESKTSTTTGTTLPGSSTTNTKNFIDDLKEAYKTGLFTGGTKTKEFMSRYGLDSSDIVRLRTGIDQGLGTVIGSSDESKIGSNVLKDIVGDLRSEGILTTASRSPDFLQQRASNIFEPGMSRFDKLPIYENPEGIFQTAANFTNQYNPILRGFDLLAGGSSQGMRGLYYGRNELGLEGDELNNFAAAVANDRDLYNQMMKTPEMQNYELNEFRAEANKNAMAQRRGGDPDPISGSQGGEGGEGGEGDGTTDPGTDPVYTPPPQNYYTFFDPNLGRYRSGTYDEYLQYVTAKDGGIIQLQQGGTDEDPIANAPGGVLPQGRKEQLEDLLTSLQEISDIKPNPKFSSEQEGKTMLMDDVNKKMNELLRNIKGNPTTVGLSGEAVKMAEEDQPAKGILNIDVPSDSGPALRDELSMMGKVKDSGLSLLMEALRKSDITEGSANQFIEEALNNFVAAGIIPPNTSYDQLTDPFKDLITREAAMIAKSENMKQEMSMFRDPKGKRGLELEEPIYKMQEGKPEDFEQINPVMRDIDTRIMNRTFNRSGDMYEVADGGIISLKDGGMNDMMAADSLMFKDPSDEGEWEYNV